ncbi:MAG: hypothetical protein RL204_1124 [Bacteroidota bacterium]|jgi:pimeloyl-ACP methyl ester carboxylesterase
MLEKKVKFKSYDGYELDGTLIKASNEKGALLFVHGITSSRDELGFHSDYANYLSENGITTMRFDYRFHGGKHDGNTKLENLSLCGIVNDIDAAFSELKNNVGNKIKSFFIVGTSFGGGLSAFWVDSNKKTEIKKVILNAPVLNYENDVLERNGLVANGSLSDKAQKQLKKKGFVNSSDIHFGRGLINELKYVNGINALRNLGNKVVIFHGKDDEDVPLSSSKKYKSTATQLEIIPKVGHGFGVEDDEDLDFPETKEIHRGIYCKALQIIESTL